MILFVLLMIAGLSGSSKPSTPEETASGDRFIENLRRAEEERAAKLKKDQADCLNQPD